MVEVNFSGNFLSAENCKANDVGVFVDEGTLNERSKNGKTWNQLSISVEVGEKKYNHSFRSSEGKRFQEAYGKETKNWIGKKFKITFIPYVDNEKKIQQGIELVPEVDIESPKEVSSVQT